MLSIYKRQQYEIKSLKEANKNLVEHCNWLWERFDLKGKETAEKIICVIKTFSYDKEFTKTITRIIAERFGVEIKE
jgi:hypothetical protein